MKLYLGGDVSKGYADWVILSGKKQIVLKNFQLDDTYAGHCKLYSVIEACFKKHLGLEMYAVRISKFNLLFPNQYVKELYKNYFKKNKLLTK